MVKDVEIIDRLKDTRRRVFKFSGGNIKFTIAGVHLKSGDHKNDQAARLRDLNEVMQFIGNGDSRFVVCGNFNEHLYQDSNIVKKLQEKGLKIGEKMQHMLNTVFTVYKQRSAMQYQVAKMSKEDKSTKDAVFGCTDLDLSH